MDSSELSPGGRLSQTRTGLKGPRPTQLRVSKESHKIKKPPVPLPPVAPQPQPQALQPAATTTESRQPVVIYAVSPKVIHTTVSDFMDLVQRLTGSSSSSGVPSTATVVTGGGDISPAARLASIEKASPSGREKDRETAADVFEIAEGVEVSQIPGILSHGPATLPAISPGLFSPPSDPQNLSFLHDLSPFMYGSNAFLPSPSTLYGAPLISPSPSSVEPFNPFFDF